MTPVPFFLCNRVFFSLCILTHPPAHCYSSTAQPAYRDPCFVQSDLTFVGRKLDTIKRVRAELEEYMKRLTDTLKTLENQLTQVALPLGMKGRLGGRPVVSKGATPSIGYSTGYSTGPAPTSHASEHLCTMSTRAAHSQAWPRLVADWLADRSFGRRAAARTDGQKAAGAAARTHGQKAAGRDHRCCMPRSIHIVRT